MSRTVNVGYVYSTELVVTACGECGIPFGMPEDFQRLRRQDHESWWCPNGHERNYVGESDAEKYKRLHAQAEDRAARLTAERDQIEASRRAWKGQVTQLRKRTIEGDCPLCGQHLRDLARHVGRIHPGEAVELAEAEVTR